MYDFTEIEKYPVAVLGGGSVGRTCAADCKLGGNTVRLFDIQPFAQQSLKYLERSRGWCEAYPCLHPVGRT